MRPRSLSSVAAAVSGRLTGPDAEVTRVIVDSREAAAGDLYVALPGERADGHDFVADAAGRGAVGAMVRRATDGVASSVLVEDTGRALLGLAADERRAAPWQVVGITGSTGKTSVKDMTAAVLETRLRVAASPRSFNTEVGVPLTLLGAPPDAEVVVCEMGSRGPGHIALIAAAAAPTIGVVTNVGLAHMELFGSAEAIAEAKAELVEALPAGGTAVLNADDPVVRSFAGRTRVRTVLFGAAPDAEIRADEVTLDDGGRA
ncbi:MAG TPA: UDP-N-acetylmuramoyl-tripeptide--D-alanyl-D-alanine ligase, partial [Actinomycetota bacterium]